MEDTIKSISSLLTKFEDYIKRASAMEDFIHTAKVSYIFFAYFFAFFMFFLCFFLIIFF